MSNEEMSPRERDGIARAKHKKEEVNKMGTAGKRISRMKPTPDKVDTKSDVDIVAEEIRIYMLGDKYYALVFDDRVNQYKLLSGLSATGARMHWEKAEVERSEFVRELTVIHGIRYEVDFLQPAEYKVEIDMSSRDVVLVERINPSESWINCSDYDRNIVDEYNSKIFGGQLDDLIKIVILSIKFKENKMNKLLLTGGSNKGKSEAFRQMEFFSVSSSTFKYGLDGSKGWGKDQVENLSKCGLLLVDDIDHTPGLEFKSITDVFSPRVHFKGNPALPLKFLAMTSTHSAIFDGAGEEIINRVLHMSLGDDFIFDDSLMWRENPGAYRESTVKYIRNTMLKVLKESSTRVELSHLQEKYRMSSDNALGEIIVKTVNEVYDALEYDEGYREGSKLHRVVADAGVHSGEMFIQNMTEIRGFIRECLKGNSRGTTIDFSKYVNDILGSIVGSHRVKYEGRMRYPILSASDNRLLLKYIPDDDE